MPIDHPSKSIPKWHLAQSPWTRQKPDTGISWCLWLHHAVALPQLRQLCKKSQFPPTTTRYSPPQRVTKCRYASQSSIDVGSASPKANPSRWKKTDGYMTSHWLDSRARQLPGYIKCAPNSRQLRTMSSMRRDRCPENKETRRRRSSTGHRDGGTAARCTGSPSPT